MTVAITYKGAGPWGAGQDDNLSADQINNNFYNLAQAVVTLQSSRPQPDNIASISVVGTTMNVFLQSGTQIGPLPLPFLRFGWKGPLTASTNYAAADVFTVDGKGIYFVNIAFTSGADLSLFNENQTDTDDNPILLKLFGFDQSSDSSYDIGVYYAGRIGDQTVGYLYQEQLLRGITIPATDAHNAYLQEPAAANLSLPILVNDNPVGSVMFNAGENAGGFVWTSGDVSLSYRDRLAIGLPATPDATAAGLSVGFGAVKA